MPSRLDVLEHIASLCYSNFGFLRSIDHEWLLLPGLRWPVLGGSNPACSYMEYPEVSVGTLIQGMVLDTLSGRSPLYRLEEFFKYQDTQLLLGQEVNVIKLTARLIIHVVLAFIDFMFTIKFPSRSNRFNSTPEKSM